MNTLSQRDLELHIPVIGWLFIIGHALFMLVGVFVFLLLTSIGAVSREAEAVAVLGVVGTSIAFLLTGLALPGLLAGYGLLKRRSWSRMLALVVSILGLFNFPVGTLIGLYAMWVLLQPAADGYFSPVPPVQRTDTSIGTQATHA